MAYCPSCHRNAFPNYRFSLKLLLTPFRGVFSQIFFQRFLKEKLIKYTFIFEWLHFGATHLQPV
jgi:hypothetical protein